MSQPAPSHVLAAERLAALAAELRRTAEGRPPNPPGVPFVCLPILAQRIRLLADQVPHDMTHRIRAIGTRVGQRSADLSPEETSDLADRLDGLAVQACNGRLPKIGAGGAA